MLVFGVAKIRSSHLRSSDLVNHIRVDQSDGVLLQGQIIGYYKMSEIFCEVNNHLNRKVAFLIQ